MRIFELTALWFLVTIGGAAQEPVPIQGTCVKVCQITGDRDSARRVATVSLTATRFGFPGTDLGSSFEHRGKLWFLFGDTPGRPGDRDVLAWTDAARAEDLVLEARVAADGKFEPLTVPGLTQGAFEVPTCGLSQNCRMYVLFTAGHSRRKVMERSVLAVSEDDGRTFKAIGEFSRKHFVNATMASLRPEDAPGLSNQNWSTDPDWAGVAVWGTGEYRKSSPRLCILRHGLGDAADKLFYAGNSPTLPPWTANEDEAAPLFEHPVCGEISVAWIKELSRWVMLYNSSDPRGIVMRTAPRPEGPWSAPSVIFDPWREGGYPQSMHVSWKHARLDAFHDPGRENEWGGEYGPYLIPRFTRGDASRATIFFTLSTWNPYQVVLMGADLGTRREGPESHAWNVMATLPGSEGWTATPEMFETFERGGKPHVTTFTKKKDAQTGIAWRDFTTHEGGALSFTLHGGHAEVVLVADKDGPSSAPSDAAAFYARLKAGAFGTVLEAIGGADSNAAEIPIRWSVDRFAGRKLRIYVVDHLTEPWGFVSLSEITIHGSVRR